MLKNLKILLLLFIPLAALPNAQAQSIDDREIEEFLRKNKSKWRDMNVPFKDGQILYDLIIENDYQDALEIGTSTGHSTIWIAWALSKTGGRLTTIEIDESRYQEAKVNLEQLGLLQFVDMHLADAHQLVKELAGPFDFVFSDADKEWYKQYFIDVDPKLKVGGCFTAHNTRTKMDGISEFMDYVKAQSNYDTSIHQDTSRSGLSVSYKRAKS